MGMLDDILGKTLVKDTTSSGNTSDGSANSGSDTKPTSSSAPVSSNSDGGNTMGDSRQDSTTVNNTMMRSLSEEGQAIAQEKTPEKLTDQQIAERAAEKTVIAMGGSDEDLKNAKATAASAAAGLGAAVATSIGTREATKSIDLPPEILSLRMAALDAAQGARAAGVTSAQEFKLETGVNFETQLANKGQQQSTELGMTANA